MGAVIALGVWICVGLLLGLFLQFDALLIVTLVAIALALFLWVSHSVDLEILIPIIFTTCGSVVVVSMWVTYYIATDQTFVQEFFTMHILR